MNNNEFSVGKDGILKSQQIKNLVDEINSTPTKEKESTAEEISENISLERKDNVVLFFSFDIANSTLYKTVDDYGWSVVISSIINRIKECVKASVKVNNAEVWRILGDEVLFVKHVGKDEEIVSTIDGIYEILQKICAELEEDSFFGDQNGLPPRIVNLIKKSCRLSLKAAAWIAIVTEKNSISPYGKWDYVENLREFHSDKGEYGAHEFIGIDIDTGFRIAENTLAKQLVISFDLALILCENEDLKENLYIITYRKLKGVWDNQAYPIIWYFDKNKSDASSLEDSFPYDAINQDDLYKEYYEWRQKPNRKVYDVKAGALEKIGADRHLLNKKQRILSAINESPRKYLDVPKLELHCAVVCLNKDDKVLIAKRGEGKDNAGKWEVGCAKASSRKELKNGIEEEYKRDFNIDISLLCDDERKDIEPHPIAVYSVTSGNENHKGIVFVAKIISGDVKLVTGKHSEYKLLSLKEAEEFLTQEECVPDLIDSIKKAFEYYEKRKQGT